MTTLKFLLCVISVAILAFAYWFYFTPQGQVWRIKNQISISWKKPKSYERPADKDEKKSEPEVNVRPEAPQTRMYSSARRPIVLEDKRNYVTGDSVTYIVPSDMKTLELQIQDRVGRVVQTYKLPNYVISIKPNQRIRLKVY